MSVLHTMRLLTIFRTSRCQRPRTCLKKSRSLCSHLVSNVIGQKANKAINVRLCTAERLFVNKLDPYDEGILGTISTLWSSVDRLALQMTRLRFFSKPKPKTSHFLQ